MAGLGQFFIDDLLTFYANTHDPSDGSAADASSAPSYRVYEEETATPILTGTMALLDSANTTGLYSEQVTLSTANGFENGKSYGVYIEATVAGVTGTMSHHFKVDLEPLAPTTTGRTLDVTATGEAGIDLDNAAGALGTAQFDAAFLTAALIATDAITNAKIANDAIGATEIANGAIDAATFAAGAIDAAAIAADALTPAKFGDFSEPSQGAPPATTDPITAIAWWWMAFRNAETQTSSLYTVSNDAGTVLAKATVSDDGTTTTKAEMVSGP